MVSGFQQITNNPNGGGIEGCENRENRRQQN